MTLLYRHKNCKDAAVQVKMLTYDEARDLYKVRVIWWNIGDCHEPWCMEIMETIEVPLKVWQSDWSVYKVANS